VWFVLASACWYFGDWRITIDQGPALPPLVKHVFPLSFQLVASSIVGLIGALVLLLIDHAISKAIRVFKR
jgi:hypothetical protein